MSLETVLFMGHMKVGSTSLQAHLATHVGALEKAGILYPATSPEGLAHNRALIAGERRGADLGRFGILAPHNALAYRMLVEGGHMQRLPGRFEGTPASEEIAALIERQIAETAPRTLLYCAEIFGRFGRHDPALVADLKARFTRGPVRWLCTLRRPDDYLISWHVHRLKIGDRTGRLASRAIRDYAGSIHLDYRRFLAPWIDTFGTEAMVLSDYAEVREAGGSVPAFLAASRLPIPPDLPSPPDRNLGLHRALAEIARRGNHALPPGPAKTLRKFLEETGPALDLPPSREIEMIGARRRRWLAREFAPVARWLDGLVDRPRFFQEIDRMTDTAPLPEMEAARAALAQLQTPGRLAACPETARPFLTGLRLPRLSLERLL
ncbi:hypothetical protein [Litorisediminicola beolgyonensis]|uniref:Sulfotransferase family protein n=1 Tax=Litorisediminicola beolgyonensis TaxID=1173614 RepID=A0ABW3ZMP7_9RHOB